MGNAKKSLFPHQNGYKLNYNRKIMKKLLLSLLMSVTMLSCADKAQPEQITAPGKVAINFSSNILQQSKATDAGFENDDRIGVYVT